MSTVAQSTLGHHGAWLAEEMEDSDYECSPRRARVRTGTGVRLFTEGDDSDYEGEPVTGLVAGRAACATAEALSVEPPRELQDDSDYEEGGGSDTDVSEDENQNHEHEQGQGRISELADAAEVAAPAPAPAAAAAAAAARSPEPPPATLRAGNASGHTLKLLERCDRELMKLSDPVQVPKPLRWRDLPARDDMLEAYPGEDTYAKIASLVGRWVPTSKDEIVWVLVKALALETPLYSDTRSFLRYVRKTKWNHVLGHLCENVVEWELTAENQLSVQSCLEDMYKTLLHIEEHAS